ncbi:aspartate/glutamate racemase family protein [Caldimonas tepidiphila]|uniref:aspartate/glutamate racemase family protein n=1 Tax=Caldimonas tepidiphila TaxID=2315841 RepID=UPI000E5B79C9|nr:aspartate/glutamate racemase family protein [Caldimonas tepidiphila]
MSEIAAGPRIALIHAVYVAMAPVEAAFSQRWPQAQRVNLVDDALPADLERDGQLTDTMRRRIRRLAEHAIDAGAEGVLFTCSAFGEAIGEAASVLPVPVLKPNEAMFEAALAAGQRIGMLATFAAAVVPMEAEFLAMARARGVEAALEVVCIPEALAAAKAGDLATHDRLHVEAAPRLAHCDAVMLAHFSNSRCCDAVQSVLPCPVLSAPDAAINVLRERLRLP